MGVKGSLARLLGQQPLLLISGVPTLGPHLPAWTGKVTVPAHHLKDWTNHKLQPFNQLRVQVHVPQGLSSQGPCGLGGGGAELRCSQRGVTCTLHNGALSLGAEGGGASPHRVTR